VKVPNQKIEVLLRGPRKEQIVIVTLILVAQAPKSLRDTDPTLESESIRRLISIANIMMIVLNPILN
jgi:hypothetical protein